MSPIGYIRSKSSPPSGLFLQSEGWARFQKVVGRKVERIFDTQIIYRILPFGLCYGYIPRGVDLPKQEWASMLKYIKESGAVFARVEPFHHLKLRDYSLRRVRDFQPSTTRMLDLSMSEDELRAQMKHKTRYNIRLAERKGVEVKTASPYSPPTYQGGAKGYLDIFLELLKQTKKRKEFRVHPPGYYRRMVMTLQGGECKANIFVAKFQGKTLAANIVLSCGDTVTYLHGASSDEHKNVMAPYLLQWRIIQWAKRKGFRWYDFWGVAPGHENTKTQKHKNTKHPLAGVSRFKEGFGGQVVRYPGTFEIPLRRFWYLLIRLYRLFRL